MDATKATTKMDAETKIQEAMQLLDDVLLKAEYMPDDTASKVAVAYDKLQNARLALRPDLGY